MFCSTIINFLLSVLSVLKFDMMLCGNLQDHMLAGLAWSFLFIFFSTPDKRTNAHPFSGSFHVLAHDLHFCNKIRFLFSFLCKGKGTKEILKYLDIKNTAVLGSVDLGRTTF